MFYIELIQKHKDSIESGLFHYSVEGDLAHVKSVVINWLDYNGYQVHESFDFKNGCVIHAEHKDGIVWIVDISNDAPHGVEVVEFATVGGVVCSGV